MLSKNLALAALASVAAAQYNVVVNNTPDPIAYAFVGPYDSIMSGGTIQPNGGAQNFDLGSSYNVKMCFDCDPSSASSGILQFEYSLVGSSGVSYDWSLVNGPNPFSGYEHAITPWSGSCPTFDCQAGDSSNDCQYTTSNDFNPGYCGLGGSPVLTATIG